jgi:molecular chaperone GrpE (heat shock protein)
VFDSYKNKIAEEIADKVAKNIRNEIDELRQNLASDVEKICAENISAMSSSFAERLSLTNSSIGERLSLINSFLGKSISSINASMAERFISLSEAMENRLVSINSSLDDRIAAAKAALEERFSATSELEYGDLSLVELSLKESLSSMGCSLDERLAEVEERLQQSLRHERRSQMALESILETQNKTLEALGRQEISPPIEALMSLAENFALTRLAEPNTSDSILYNKLSKLMDCFDLALVSEIGVQFDHDKHEACGARYEPDSPDGAVLEIVRPGFLMKGTVLRYATVIVNRHDYTLPVDSENIT